MKKTKASPVRKGISKKLRFEIFKRDKFCCQFCGQSSPKVILEIDHLTPVCKGGKNDILNLLTACFDCNRGKSKNKISDDSVIKKQKEQLEILQERREQLELMAKWREELSNLDDEFAKHCSDIFKRISGQNWALNDYGKNDIIKLRKKYSDKDIFEVCEISFRQYYHFPKKAAEISEQWNKSVDYIPKILAVRKSQQNDPILTELYYCRGILKNKSNAYFNSWKALDYLKELVSSGWEIEDIKEACKSCNGWSNFLQITQ